MIDNNFKRNLKYAIKISKRYTYTSIKLKRKLLNKNISIQNINIIIDILNKEKLIDDDFIIKEVINEYIYKYYGIYKIKDRLVKMGFPVELINNYISNINKELLDSRLEEYVSLNIIDLNNKEKRIKFINKCLRRGYDINSIKRFISL